MDPIKVNDAEYQMIHEELNSLRKMKFTDDQILALKKLMIEVGRSVAFDMLSIIDGVVVSEVEELPEMALIDRMQGKPLTENLLHEEFYEFLPD
jgi:hypothetical protein